MLRLLWLIIWVTVSNGFYDELKWHSSNYGVHNEKSYASQKHNSEMFLNTLRRFANTYSTRRDAEEEMTITKAKSRLRLLKIYEHTGQPDDFDTSKAQMLPLSDGSNFCTMGRHTKVDCNHCTCVAGQLYMCTGMICPEPHDRPQFLSTCREGKQRKIDSCNYCYCRDGHEYCSTRDCRLNHDLPNLRNGLHQPSKHKCRENMIPYNVTCKKCICFQGEEFCNESNCKGGDHHWKKGKHSKHKDKENDNKKNKEKGHRHVGQSDDEENNVVKNKDKEPCENGRVRKQDCNLCKCANGYELCEMKECLPNGHHLFPKPKTHNIPYYPRMLRYDKRTCIEGTRYQMDSCNYCVCFAGSQTCTNNICPEVNLDGTPCQRYEYQYPKSFSCNKCSCRQSADKLSNGAWTWHCTKGQCGNRLQQDSASSYLDNNALRRRKVCDKWDIKYVDCNRCSCHANIWICTQFKCSDKDESKVNPDLLYDNCKDGDKRKIDECNYCYCITTEWYCEQQLCAVSGEQSELEGPIEEYEEYGEVRDRSYTRHRPVVRQTNDGTTQTNKADNDDIEMYSFDDFSAFTGYGGVILVPTEPENGFICPEGAKRRRDPCNICYCRDDHWFCENFDCRHHSKERALRENSLRYYSRPRCKIGAKKLFDCLKCVCKIRHRWICKQIKDCTSRLLIGETLSSLRNSEEDDTDDEQQKCKPGDRYRSDRCNVCYCTPDGKRTCTKNTCSYPKITPNNVTQTYGKEYEELCSPSDKWRVDRCNYCYCDYNRKTVCTSNKCSNYRSINSLRSIIQYVCRAGEILQIDDCNYCQCTFRRKWRCTRNMCPSTYDHMLLRSTPCTEGSRREVNACNYCVCQKGLEYCTQKPCWNNKPPPFNVTDPECQPSEPLAAPDPCNLCICLNSNIMCTDVPCSEDKSGRRSKICIEGEKYRMSDGCNFCVCRSGQKHCTMIACTASMGGITKNILTFMRSHSSSHSQSYTKHLELIEKLEQDCIPGKNYRSEDDDPNCPNDCICVEGEILCTDRHCKEHFNTDPDGPYHTSYWPTSRADHPPMTISICKEGERILSDSPCNSCICLNGRKVCAIIPCTESDDDIASEETLLGIKSTKTKGTKGNMDTKKKNVFCEPFTFFSPDKNRFCRNCFCLHNSLALCLLNLCKYSKDIPHITQNELSDYCTPGQSGYPTMCVTCTCSHEHKWICSREEFDFCHERDCDAKDEFNMGFFPYCAGCRCSVREWYCSIQPETCSDYSNVTCPLGTFIQNPRQHCSICLCGGYGEDAHNMCFTEAKCVKQVNVQKK